MKDIKKEKPVKSKAAARLFLKIIPTLLLTWMAIYTIAMVIAVQKQVNIWQTHTRGVADTISCSREEWRLIRDKTFLEARIALAGNDSIAMTIDFRDSLVQLETKGVVLRQIKFKKSEISGFFMAFNPVPYSVVFSRPFKITEIEGSIMKEPIRIKKAPRDTTEASQNTTAIDTGRVEFVEWHLLLDSTFVVSFVQDDRYFGIANLPSLKYRFRRHYHTLLETHRDMLRFRLPAYHPEMTVFISKNEAKSFYRALPKNGFIAVKL